MLDSSFPHGLGKHIGVRFAKDRVSRVVAVCQAFEQVLNAEQADDPLAMVHIRICEEPSLDFGLVKVLEHLPQLRVGLDDALQRQCIVHFRIILERVNLVVSHEALNGQPVVLIVLLMESDSLFLAYPKVLRKVIVDQACHQVMDFGTCKGVSESDNAPRLAIERLTLRIQTVVYVTNMHVSCAVTE